MENIFPLKESVEIEEIYGSKRPNAVPPKCSKAFGMVSGVGGFVDVSTYQTKYPGWFMKGELSLLEKVSMEETILAIGEERYLRARDGIVCSYEEGSRPMSIGKALTLVDVDLLCVLRIFSFLERWKLVNHRNPMEREIRHLESSKGVRGDDPAREDSKQEGSKQIVDLKRHLEEAVCGCGGKVAFFTRSLAFKCSECISSGNYPQEVLRSDFLQITESLSGSMWSKKEEFLLLEAINRFGDEWSLVSQHVQTKTKEQCILHFLRLPILENTFSKADFSVGRPFETAENPTMCTIVFICGIVHPKVASECARVAIKHIGKCSQETVVHHILEAAREKAAEQRSLEKAKIERIRNVMCEGLLNKIKMKVGTCKDLYLSTQRVRSELVGLRRSLVEELGLVEEE